jgi:hypothetical protein
MSAEAPAAQPLAMMQGWGLVSAPEHQKPAGHGTPPAEDVKAGQYDPAGAMHAAHSVPVGLEYVPSSHGTGAPVVCGQ